MDDRHFFRIDFLRNNQQALLLHNLAALLKEIIPLVFSVLPRPQSPFAREATGKLRASALGLANFMAMTLCQLVRLRVDSFELVIAKPEQDKKVGFSQLMLWAEVGTTQDLEIKLHVPSLKGYLVGRKDTQLAEAKGFIAKLVLPFSYSWAKSLSNSKLSISFNKISLSGTPASLV